MSKISAGSPVITPRIAREQRTAESQATSSVAEVRNERVDGHGARRADHLSNWARNTLDGGVAKVVRKGWEEIGSEHSIDPSFNAGNFKVGFKISEDIIEADQLTPLQKQVAQDLAISEDKNVVWVKTQTMVQPGVGVSPDLSADLSINFNLDTQLVLEVTQPLLFDDLGSGVDAAKKALKSHSVDHPLKADAAFEMPPGSSFKLLGRGKVSGAASVGRSGSTAVLGDYIDVGYGARAGVRASREGTYEVKGSVLNDGSIRSVVSEIDRSSRSISASAWAGLRAQPTIEDKLFDKIPGLEGNSIGERAGEALFDQIKDRVSKLKVSLAAGASSGSQRQVLSSYHFDGSPNSRKNYDDGLPLNLSKLDAAAKRPEQTGVTLVRYTEDQDTSNRQIKMNALGHKLFLLSSTTRTERGMLVEGNDSTMHTSGKYEKESSFGPWGHSSMGEAVHVERTKDDETRVEDYVHLNYKLSDAVPRDSEVDKLRNFTEAMGIPGADQIIAPDNNFFSSLFSSDDNMKFECDLYFTDEGAQQVVQTPVDQRRAAVAMVASKIDPEVGVVQINNPEVKALAKEYWHKKENSSSNDTSWEGSMAHKYARLIGVDLKDMSGRVAQHMEVFRIAAMIEEHIGKFAGSGEEWTHLFPDMMKDMKKEDYMVVLPAMKMMAGADNVLVHTFHISDKEGTINLDVPDEGIIRHPRADAHGAIHSNNG